MWSESRSEIIGSEVGPWLWNREFLVPAGGWVKLRGLECQVHSSLLSLFFTPLYSPDSQNARKADQGEIVLRGVLLQSSGHRGESRAQRR